MNKLLLTLFLFPLPAFADITLDAAQEFTRTASAIAAPDWIRVSHRKAASGVDDVGLLAPSKLFFTAAGDLTEKGRTLLKAEYSRSCRMALSRCYVRVMGEMRCNGMELPLRQNIDERLLQQGADVQSLRFSALSMTLHGTKPQ